MELLLKPASRLRRNVVAALLLYPTLVFLASCGAAGGGGGGSSSAGAGGNPGTGAGGSTHSSTASATTSSGSPPVDPWTLGQSLTKSWDVGWPTWEGGNSVSFANVRAGSTLVLCAYGIREPAVPFQTPADSAGQNVVVAVATGTEGAVQAVAWVVHNATAGAHTWTNLPDLSTGDGKLFFAEFRHSTPSSIVLGAATQTLHAYVPPWLTSGSVTMAAGAHTGDLLVAFSFEEEGSLGHEYTPYTDPPAGWASLGVQHASLRNIAGEACWRTAPDTKPQTVKWEWSYVEGQNPTLFKGAIFAIHAP